MDEVKLLKKSRDIGPCGEICKICKVKEKCPVTLEQWQTWLSVDMYNPVSKEDAMTPARKFEYMKYSNENGSPMDWVELLLTKSWIEVRRDDYVYRYPLKGNELRAFMSEIIKDNLTYRERQVVTMHLGLDSGKAVPFSQMSKLFSIKADKLGLIYREAIGKLSEAILAHPKWRRSK
jgi:hypothetical protein